MRIRVGAPIIEECANIENLSPKKIKKKYLAFKLNFELYKNK